MTMRFPAEMAHTPIHSKTQQSGSNLKSTWAIHEGNLLTDFKVCAGGVRICRKFLWELKHWCVLYFLPTLPIWPNAHGFKF